MSVLDVGCFTFIKLSHGGLVELFGWILLIRTFNSGGQT